MLRETEDLYEPISDINVTPFVDVLLVLLVIFMVTAPLFTKAIPVQLPQEHLRSSSVKDIRKFIITVNRNGNYFIRGKRHSLKKILKAAIQWRERYPGRTAFIRADKRVRYGKITHLMVELKNNGIQNIGLLVAEKGKK